MKSLDFVALVAPECIRFEVVTQQGVLWVKQQLVFKGPITG